MLVEQQITYKHCGHILTNVGVWSPDGEWIVYDTRSDRAGDLFDGLSIERVNIGTGDIETLYRSHNGAYCGVVTHHPQKDEVIFILGPENPAPGWQYGPYHRQGVIVEAARKGVARNLDACNLVPPFVPGALRGGSHVHVFSPDGQWVSFTYEDHLLAQFREPGPDHDMNLRGIGVSVPAGPVKVGTGHRRNHDGEYFTVLVTRTTPQPKPGSDEIKRACEEAWVGTNGYVLPDGARQTRALAFQGQVVTASGDTISEVFIADLPDDLTQPGDGPLAGTERRAPAPPKGVQQRRLTFTAQRKHPGIQGPRHWLRSSPDGSQIAFLMKDNAGVVQIWSVSPNGMPTRQITHNPTSIASAFTWSPDGQKIAHIMDGSVCVTDVASGETKRLTERDPQVFPPCPLACVFSPDGRKIAYLRPTRDDDFVYNQVYVVRLRD